MILKVKSTNLLGERSTTWRFIEDIHEISTTSGIMKDGKVFPLIYVPRGRSSCEEIPGEYPVYECQQVQLSNEDSEYVSILYLFLNSGDTRVLAVQEAYLLNDSGKTIERL